MVGAYCVALTEGLSVMPACIAGKICLRSPIPASLSHWHRTTTDTKGSYYRHPATMYPKRNLLFMCVTVQS